MTVRAKLRVERITSVQWGATEPQVTLRLVTQYDSSIPEDQRFQKATPTGYCELQIDNPAALAQFTVGKAYYLDFTEAP